MAVAIEHVVLAGKSSTLGILADFVQRYSNKLFTNLTATNIPNIINNSNEIYWLSLVSTPACFNRLAKFGVAARSKGGLLGDNTKPWKRGKSRSIF